MISTRMPALFLGHGSPMTVISDGPARRSWVALGQALPRPKAVLVVSAHWETEGTTHVTAGPSPRTIHDFRGFPAELFAMQYPAPGSDDLTQRIAALLGPERVRADDSWGFDHGAWGVMQPMYPAADVPMVAMSLNRTLSTEEHLAIGAALAPLRDEGVLLIGSGNIIHNLRLWREAAGAQLDWALDFRARTNAAILAGDHAALTHFAADDQPAAVSINSAEHYLPLLYTLGAQLPGDEVSLFNDTVEGALSMTSVLVGDSALAGSLAST